MESQDSSDKVESQRLERCEERIEYQFKNRALLRSALTHASAADSRSDSNERLEFLGDAILGVVVCEAIFQEFPNYQEGELTKIKSVVVSRNTCSRISQLLKIEDLLFLGKGLSKKGPLPSSLLGNVFEALVAAIYLDGGLGEAKRFILRFIEDEICKAVENGTSEDFKSRLQRYAQKEFGMTPTDKLLGESGPDHSKEFEVAANVNGQQYGSARGRSKKDAEQKAAFKALESLKQSGRD